MNEAGGGEPKQQFEVAQGKESVERPLAEPAVEEARPALKESAAGKQATPAALQPLPVVPDVPVSAPVVVLQDGKSAPAVAPTAKPKAAHSHKIEKEWVDKAKSIVAQTKDDPYKQKKEMSKVKADYIGQRYGKIIKTDDAVAA